MKTNRSFWPFGIIIAFVLFALGVTVLVTVACSNRNDLVASDYYEQEIRFQGQMDRLSRAQSLPAKATATYDSAARTIKISLPHQHASAGAQGEVLLYRPSAAGLDQRMDLRLDEGGAQTIDAAQLRPGLWKVKVAWSSGDHDYAIEESVIVGTINF